MVGFGLRGGMIPTRARPAATSAPVNTVPPSMGGIFTQAQTITINPGSWVGLPSSAFVYEHQRWNGSAWVAIAGATSASRTATADDVAAGANGVRGKVTASNDYNGSSSTVAYSAAVTIAAPLTLIGTPPVPTVGVVYNFTPTKAGGHAAAGYVLTGTLPAGLNFNPATGAITGTPSTSGTASGLDITVTDVDGLTASLGAFSIAVSVGGADPLEALSVGSAGAGFYSGYNVVHIQPFDGTLADALVRPGNPYGYLEHNFSERDRRRTSATSVGALGDRYWTGWQDAGDGLPITSYADVLDVSGGSLRMKARPATTEEKALNGPRTNASGPAYLDRPMVWAAPTMYGDHALKGEGVLEVRFRLLLPTGMVWTDAANPASSYWRLSVEGGSEAGSNPGGGWVNEEDDFELHIGGGEATSRPLNATTDHTIPLNIQTDGSWQILRMKYVGTTITVENWSDNFGALLATDTLQNSATNLDTLYYGMAGIFNVTSNTSTSGVFDLSQWTGKSQEFEISAVRVWSAGSTLTPQGSYALGAAPLVLEFGGTGSVVIPSQASLWGGAVDVEYVRGRHGYDTNGPGRASDLVAPMETRTSLPAGASWTAGTRTLAFSSSFTAQSGVCHFYVYPKSSASGVSRPYKQAVYVKPKLALPALDIPIAGQPYSFQIPRGSPRNWDNGNLPLGTGHGLTMVSGPAWLSFDAATHTISGNCPGDFVHAQVLFRCTNGAGLYSEQIAELGWTPAQLSTGRQFVFDASRSDTTVDDGSGRVLRLQHTVSPTVYMARATASQRPQIVTNGGVAGDKRVMRFDVANGRHLRASDGANMSGVAGAGNGANFSTTTLYEVYAIKASASGIQRIVGRYNAAGTHSWQYRHGASDRGASFANGGSVTSVAQATQDTSWHVVEVIKNGSTVEVYVDGSLAASGSVASTAALTTTEYLLGASVSASTIAAAFDGDVAAGAVYTTIPDNTNRAKLRTWAGSICGLTL